MKDGIERQDYLSLVEVFASHPDFRTEDGRWKLVDQALRGIPRADAATGGLDLRDPPRDAAGSLVGRLLDFGRLGQRQSLSLVLEALRERVGDDRRAELDRLIGVLEGYQATNPNSPGQASPAAPGSSAAAHGAQLPRDLVYISYRHRDREWHERLRRILDADPRLRGRVWDDTEFAAGGDWQREIDAHLPRARVMIMLASDDYFDPAVSGAFASEVIPALAAHAQGELTILWLPVRPMSIGVAPVRHITAATGAGTVPLANLSPDGQAQALIRVYREVLRLLGLPAEPLSPDVRMAVQPPAELSAPSAAGPTTTASALGLPPALAMLRDAVCGAGAVPDLGVETLYEILRHPPADLGQYRLGRIAEWSQPRYAIDKRFTRLTLLLDQGPQAEGPRWQAQRSFDDLREVLAEADDQALVLLGPPGCGKSTLLRRLELDLAVSALRADPGTPAPITFFLPLSRYAAITPGTPPPLPGDWLEGEWARRYPGLPPLPEALRDGRMVLLLDAVNEIPHRDAADYGERIGLWRAHLAELARRFPGTRAVFSCRSLDYSASLSTADLPVPHVRIEQLADAQVEEFLTLYGPEHGSALWAQLRSTPQLDLFRSPFYLRLLLAQAGADGVAPGGRAALFTGFVRQSLLREVTAANPLFRQGYLLDRRDHERLARNEWRTETDLPGRGPLLPALWRLAFELQGRRAPGETSRVRAPYDDALDLLGGEAEDLLHAGVALQVLEVQWEDVLYVHQLMQEYFAARALATAPQPDLARSPWRVVDLSPSLDEVLRDLADSDPLPAAPATGWEETFLLAAPMAESPEGFVEALAEVNLPLAARAAAQPDLAVSPALRDRLGLSLVARSRDPEADLRARIAAARALGELGDPRFERREGPHGAYLRPPVFSIPAGTYTIGSDEGLYEDETPAHAVTLPGDQRRVALLHGRGRLRGRALVGERARSPLAPGRGDGRGAQAAMARQSAADASGPGACGAAPSGRPHHLPTG